MKQFTVLEEFWSFCKMNLLAFLLQWSPFVLMNGIVRNCVQGDLGLMVGRCDPGVSEAGAKDL